MGCSSSKALVEVPENADPSEEMYMCERSVEHYAPISSVAARWSSIEGVSSDEADYDDSLIFWPNKLRSHRSAKAEGVAIELKQEVPPVGIDPANPVHKKFLKLEQKFKRLFNSADLSRTHSLDVPEFSNFVMCLRQAQLSKNDISVEDIKRNLAEMKLSQQGLEKTVAIKKQMNKDIDSPVSWPEFWELCCSDQVRPEQEGELAHIHNIFAIWEIHKTMAVHECFLQLEPKFRQVFDQCDIDHSGVIGFEEFQLFAFCYVAADLSTSMSGPEMKQVVKEVADSKEVKVEIERLFERMDQNCSKTVCWDEFWEYFLSDSVAPANHAELKKIKYLFKIWNTVYTQERGDFWPPGRTESLSY